MYCTYRRAFFVLATQRAVSTKEEKGGDWSQIRRQQNTWASSNSIFPYDPYSTVSLSYSSSCVAGRGLPLPAGGRGGLEQIVMSLVFFQMHSPSLVENKGTVFSRPETQRLKQNFNSNNKVWSEHDKEVGTYNRKKVLHKALGRHNFWLRNYTKISWECPIRMIWLINFTKCHLLVSRRGFPLFWAPVRRRSWADQSTATASSSRDVTHRRACAVTSAILFEHVGASSN